MGLGGAGFKICLLLDTGSCGRGGCGTVKRTELFEALLMKVMAVKLN